MYSTQSDSPTCRTNDHVNLLEVSVVGLDTRGGDSLDSLGDEIDLHTSQEE